jgi:hypothetical protein
VPAIGGDLRFMLFVYAREDGWAELDEMQIAEGLAARAGYSGAGQRRRAHDRARAPCHYPVSLVKYLHRLTL